MQHIISSWKFLIKKELQQIASNNLSDINFKDITKRYK